MPHGDQALFWQPCFADIPCESIGIIVTVMLLVFTENQCKVALNIIDLGTKNKKFLSKAFQRLMKKSKKEQAKEATYKLS